MHTIVIHDQRRPDEELSTCETELQRQGLTDYGVFFAVISGAPTVAGCINASHKKIVRMAKEEGWPEVCILESDVWFPAPDGWAYFLEHKPVRFDIYSAGSYDNNPILYREDRKKWPSSFVTPVPNLVGFHCYIVSAEWYDHFLAVPDDEHIDTAQTGGIFWVCYPFAALQRRSWSANHKSIQDYNGELEKQDVYGW
jgi:hypothetical protein